MVVVAGEEFFKSSWIAKWSRWDFERGSGPSLALFVGQEFLEGHVITTAIQLEDGSILRAASINTPVCSSDLESGERPTSSTIYQQLCLVPLLSYLADAVVVTLI